MGAFQNHTWARKSGSSLIINIVYKLHLSMYEKDSLCGISKVPFYTKYLTHTLKDVYFVEKWRFKSFHIYKLEGFFVTTLVSYIS